MVDITVVIPSIPPRERLLARATESVQAQTLQPVDTIIVHDTERKGATVTRQSGLDRVVTEFVAFLDDDDWLYPQHLEVLSAALGDADLVYPWFDVIGGTDPFPRWEGVPWDCSAPHGVPITWLARTDSVRSVGGFIVPWDPTQGPDPGVDAEGNRAGEDYRLILRLCQAERQIVHHPERTWAWAHHGLNTMGLATRW